MGEVKVTFVDANGIDETSVADLVEVKEQFIQTLSNNGFVRVTFEGPAHE